VSAPHDHGGSAGVRGATGPESLVDVALLAFGGPADVAGVSAFLQSMTGRAPSAETLAVVNERYAAIGGGSPLPEITARQARALQAKLVQQLAFPIRVRHGFLYTQPSVAGCLASLDAHDVLALPLSPFASRLTSDKYRAALDAAGATTVPLLEGWYANRGFVQAISKRIAEALDGCDAREWAVLFTAHNVPVETVLEGDPYAEQLQQTIAQLLPRFEPGDWRFGFQSKGRGGGEWLDPEADDVVRTLAEEGWEKLLVVPVGFVSDNVETLFDLDVSLRAVAEACGMQYRRSTPPNDSPFFIEALADLVIDHLARRPVEDWPPPEGPHRHG
jgi:protoporphyrin/coproporphyrin ferrochelatase